MSPTEMTIRFLGGWLLAVGGGLWWLRRWPRPSREIALHVYIDGQKQQFALGTAPSPEVLRSKTSDAGTRLPVRKPVRFLIDSMLVHESFRQVCRPRSSTHGRINGFKECFHYSTGVRVDERTYVITQHIPVQYSHQSAGGVRVASDSNIQTLAALDEIGLPLIAHFHSHPGFGREANRPSQTDRAFQERLERGGHIAIGGIFSRSGDLRFFAGDLDRFVVEVIGNNVRKVGDNEFQLDLGHDDVQR